MRHSLARLRPGRLVAASASVALVGGLVALAAAPAQADPVELDDVGYTCDATNSLISASLGGPAQFTVTTKTDLPASVDKGASFTPSDPTLDLTLSEALVTRLRETVMIERVRGSSRATVELDGVTTDGQTKHQSIDIDDLKVPDWKKIPSSGTLTLGAVGTLPSITAPDADGIIYVQMPKTFYLDSELDPPVLGTISEAELLCTRNSDDLSSRLIATIQLGAGCSQEDCPLGKEVTPPTSGGGGDGSSGGSSNGGTSNNGATANSGGNTSTSDGGTTYDDPDPYTYDPPGVAGTTATSTTSLPATGSPVGLGVAGILGVALVARVVLMVRNRREGRAS